MNALPGLTREASLLVFTLAAVIGLVVLIARLKVHSFIALTLASLFVGLSSGLAPGEIVKAFQEGLGRVLGDIAMIVALGSVLGRMLAESGGAEQIALTLTRGMGERRLPWAMMLIAFIVGLPVFFAVGLVLLAPILFAMARQTRTPLLRLGLPLVAALSVVHGLVPPHPGPMAAIGALGGSVGPVDTGRVIFYSLLVGLPVAILTGPLLAPVLTRRLPDRGPGPKGEVSRMNGEPTQRPGLSITLLTVLLPIVLMLAASAADVALPRGHPTQRWLGFIGSPLMAMLAGAVTSFFTLGLRRGFSGTQLLQFTSDCLGPVAGILLVVGAGGGFNGVLRASGVGAAIAGLAQGLPVSVLVLGWLFAALVRVATGSATVAITMAAGLIAETARNTAGVNLELLVLAMGAGSLILSHVNDGGFWFVQEYLNLSVPETLKTWTVIETAISVITLVLVVLLDRIV
jgi:GntP family gluconate:H+ symporter